MLDVSSLNERKSERITKMEKNINAYHNFEWFTVSQKFVKTGNYCDECGEDFKGDDVGKVALIDKFSGLGKTDYICPYCTRKMLLILGLERFLENLGCEGVLPDDDE